VREILERYQAEEVRYFILTSQYRSPLNYSDEHLDNARHALTRFYTALRGLPEATPAADTQFEKDFHAAMQDDFNTPEALATLFELVREINRVRADDEATAASLGALLRQLGDLIGILQSDAESYLRGGASANDGDAEIDALVAQRNEAKANKDWGTADEIRNKLQEMGIVLEDGPSGTTWRRG
jgi:cysteinyl-tRNA synthetase